MLPQFDIFEIESTGAVRWIEAVTDLRAATARAEARGSIRPGKYLILNSGTGERFCLDFPLGGGSSAPGAATPGILPSPTDGAHPITASRVRDMVCSLRSVTDPSQIWNRVLDCAIEITHADFGNIQLLEPQSGALRIVAHRGFGSEFVDYFQTVHDGSFACGIALQHGQRVIVEDVCVDPIFSDETARQVMLGADARAVQSTPIFNAPGKPLGMLNTHYRRPHRPSLKILEFLDLFARQSAEIIVQAGGNAA